MKKTKTTLTQKALSLWGIILIIWSFYRANFRLPIEIDEIIIKPLIFILPVIFFIKRIEQKKVADSLWINRKKLIPDIYFSVIIGLLILFFYTIINYLVQGKLPKITQISLYFLTIDFFTSISEEVLSHGFILKKLYEEKNSVIQSSFLASVLYFILRIPVLFTHPTLTGTALIYTMVTSFLLSFALSIIYLERKSLWAPIFLHFLYLTFFQVFQL